MSPADPRSNLLWPLVAENLERGRADETALAGRRSVSYGALAGAIRCGARAIDGSVPPGSRILVAGRDQQRVAIALCAALGSRSIPLLADPTSVERLRRLADEWKVAAAIGERDVVGDVGRPVLDETVVDGWAEDGGEPSASFIPRAVAPLDAAFWTFTSGTTGQPKAVVHSHRGPLAAFRAFGRGVVALGPEDVTISTAGLPFVYALGNALLFPLFAGATAILPSDLLLPTVLGELASHGATVLAAGPWSLSGIVRLARRPRWVEAIRGLRCVLSAGEPLPPSVFEEWRATFGKEVLDNLGCTEMFNSFVSNFSGRARPSSLGSGVPGFELRVGGRPAAPGSRGELEVRGESRAVAVGSSGRLSPPEGDWCATGDELEIDRDGRFVFLGRVDDRFKVKGQFVHPVEVERVLSGVAGVAQCLVRGESDGDGLAIVVAKVVAAESAAPDLVRRVLAAARAELPSFAVPARVDLVGSLARSERGKLLRR